MDYREEVLRNCPSFGSDTMEKKLSLAGLGVGGEGGEVVDIVKKILHHDASLVELRPKLIKKMGDVYWYLEYLGAALGIGREEVMQINIDKLKARHPQGWTPESQRAKADERTRAALERAFAALQAEGGQMALNLEQKQMLLAHMGA